MDDEYLDRCALRKIAGLSSQDRRRVLDRCVNAAGNDLVMVEYSWDRSFESAVKLVGRLVGTAYSPSHGASEVLIVRPAQRGKRLRALSVAQVLRISRAIELLGDGGLRDEFEFPFTLGPILAGPEVGR